MGRQEKGPIRRESGLGEGDARLARRQWFASSRTDASGTIRSAELTQALVNNRSALRMMRANLFSQPLALGYTWTPIGPGGVTEGQAEGRPIVSGRIRGLAVGPECKRIYAGAANGGLWFSGDCGWTWTPLDDYVASPSGSLTGAEGNALSVGALLVDFGGGRDRDRIFAGTGEAQLGSETDPGDGYFGIGVRVSEQGGIDGSWTLEAENLASHAFYKLAMDPDDRREVVYAATSIGVHRRPSTGSRKVWPRIESPAFSDHSAAACDVVVAGAGSTKQIFAAFWNDRVYRSVDGTEWTPVPGPSCTGRINLAASESDPSVVYALTQDGSLYRLDGGAFVSVGGGPGPKLGNGWGAYQLAIAVDPVRPDIVYLGGSYILYHDNFNLSLFRGIVTKDAHGDYRLLFDSDGDPASDPSWIGQGIHPDVHVITWPLRAKGSAHEAGSVWLGTDGGVFASDSGARSTFAGRNSGLAITETSYLAVHPWTDAIVVAGCQDNGIVHTSGEAAWRETFQGDGGGVAIDPIDPFRIMAQYMRTELYRCSDGGRPGNWEEVPFPPFYRDNDKSARGVAAGIETRQTRFYGPLAASADRGQTTVGFGTDRLWISEDWGDHWVTLPAASDPYAQMTPDLRQDSLDSPVTAIRFASPHLVFVSTESDVWRFEKSAQGVWKRRQLPNASWPPARFITALAVDDPDRGSLYVTLGGKADQHVFHYDGESWQAIGIQTDNGPLNVPMHAVEADAAHPGIVYVGTDVGCWRRVPSGPGRPPVWEPFSSGLPESAILDLKLSPTTRLLRAATYGRGIWEVDVDRLVNSDKPELYLRANSADTGRLFVNAALDKPHRQYSLDGMADPINRGCTLDLAMCPDIKVIRAGRESARGEIGGPGGRATAIGFAHGIEESVDRVQDHGATKARSLAPAVGTSLVYVQVRARGSAAFISGDVRVLLLMADADPSPPELPLDYAARIQAGDATDWAGRYRWRFADPDSPYHILDTPVDATNPGVATFSVNFAALGLPPGHKDICVAAFVTTSSETDRIQATETDLVKLIRTDRHAALKRLTLH